jgi:hypothetical protein
MMIQVIRQHGDDMKVLHSENIYSAFDDLQKLSIGDRVICVKNDYYKILILGAEYTIRYTDRRTFMFQRLIGAYDKLCFLPADAPSEVVRAAIEKHSSEVHPTKKVNPKKWMHPTWS